MGGRRDKIWRIEMFFALIYVNFPLRPLVALYPRQEC